MPYEKESEQVVDYPLEDVFKAAIFCIKHMGGKVIKQDQEKGILHAQMDKKLFGNYLGDRSKLEVQFMEQEKGQTDIHIFAYPLDAIGQKLMFGARKGVLDTILKTFYQEIEKYLQENSPSA